MALAGFPFFPAAVPNGGDIERGGGGRREGEAELRLRNLHSARKSALHSPSFLPLCEPLVLSIRPPPSRPLSIWTREIVRILVILR